MKLKAMLLAALLVTDYSAVIKKLAVEETLDTTQTILQVWSGEKLAPRTKLYNQHRYCLLCAEYMDTTLVERRKPSTTYGVCNFCWLKKDLEDKKITAIEITICLYCGKHVAGREAKEPALIYGACSDCQERFREYGFVVINCGGCSAYVTTARFAFLGNALVMYSTDCAECNHNLAAKKATDLEIFKKCLAEWEPKSVGVSL